MRLSLSFLISFCFVSFCVAGSKYPAGQFCSPVNRTIQLSGTFGELRSNHFHAGLDIKSKNGITGDTVYAAGTGYISRIKVDAFGYGNAIFIDHPNGFTTVYGHLDRYSPVIQQYVRNEQYRLQQFEVDLYPAPFQFPVEQLDEIGIMGNTGHSYGPHLHFEIRHTDTQVPVNPLHFGYTVPDQINPVIQQLIAYQFDDYGQLIRTEVLQPRWKAPGVYELSHAYQIPVSRVTFAIRAYDAQDGVYNQNGIYSLQCMADEEPSFAFSMDEIPFQDTRYLNAHIDYAQKLYQNRFFHRCFPLEGNKLPIYFKGVDDGMIYLTTEQPRHVNISVADFNGNMSSIDFEVARNQNYFATQSLLPPFEMLATPSEVSILLRDGIQVIWPEGSFYEKTPLQITTNPVFTKNEFSPEYELAPTDIPVHFFFDVSIEGSKVPDSLKAKAFIARREPDGDIINCGGTWVGNNVSSRARQMGTYAIMIDTLPPTIAISRFSPNMTNWRKMSFKIYDNVSIRDMGKSLAYSAWVDGQWILMSLDGKTGTLTHEFDGRFQAGDHELVLKVTDDRGNEAVLQKTFTL